MALTVPCGNADCQKPMKIRDELVGKRVKCPACGSIQLAARPRVQVKPSEQAADRSPPTVFPPTPRKWQRILLTAVVGLVAGFALGTIAFLGFSFDQWMRGYYAIALLGIGSGALAGALAGWFGRLPELVGAAILLVVNSLMLIDIIPSPFVFFGHLVLFTLLGIVAGVLFGVLFRMVWRLQSAARARWFIVYSSASLLVLSIGVLAVPFTRSMVIGLARGEPFYRARPISDWVQLLASDDRRDAINALARCWPDLSASVEALNDENPKIRQGAIRVLEDQHSIPDLQKAAQHEDNQVRAWAFEAIGNLHTHSKTYQLVPLLIESLDDKDEAVRLAARNAVKKLAPEVLRNREQLTVTNFWKIQPGMTVAQVEAILGKPTAAILLGDIVEGQMWDTGKNTYLVEYRNRVVWKTEARVGRAKQE